MKRTTVALVALCAVVGLAGCSGESKADDPFYAALKEAGWESGGVDLEAKENLEMLEDMARDVCGKFREQLLAGATDEELVLNMGKAIDGSNPSGNLAVDTGIALLDYRCDASQPDGMKVLD